MMPTQPRYVIISQAVNQDTVKSLISTVAQMLPNPPDELHVLINSGGGNIMAGFAAYNFLIGVPFKLITHNIGSVNSIANIIYLAGAHRRTSLASTFLFHGTSWTFAQGAEPSLSQMAEFVASLRADEERMKQVFTLRSKITRNEIDSLMLDGSTRDATFAESKGIAHEIIDFSIPHGTPVDQI